MQIEPKLSRAMRDVLSEMSPAERRGTLIACIDDAARESRFAATWIKSHGLNVTSSKVIIRETLTDVRKIRLSGFEMPRLPR